MSWGILAAGELGGALVYRVESAVRAGERNGLGGYDAVAVRLLSFNADRAGLNFGRARAWRLRAGRRGRWRWVQLEFWILFGLQC